jgi:two-component sensor histidine kinase
MIPLLLFSNINTTWSIHYLYVSADSLVHGKSVPWQMEVAPTQAPDISAYFHEAVRNSIFYGMSDNSNNNNNISLKVAQFTPETTTARYFQ